MDRETLAAMVDHTVLGPETTLDDVYTCVEEATEHGMNVCVPPCYVAEAVDRAPETTVATVIAFPHGQSSAVTKRRAAVEAYADGADELDVVLNLGRLSAGDHDAVRTELTELVAAVPVPVKVIIEAALLTDDEKHRACEAAVAADADMLKTSTGFADSGARVADVELMSHYLPVKASGGIGSYETAMELIEAGATRIGASSGVAIVTGAPTTGASDY